MYTSFDYRGRAHDARIEQTKANNEFGRLLQRRRCMDGSDRRPPWDAGQLGQIRILSARACVNPLEFRLMQCC